MNAKGHPLAHNWLQQIQDELLLQERSQPKITSDIPSDFSPGDLPSDSDMAIQDENLLPNRPEPKLDSGPHSGDSPRTLEDDKYFSSVSTDRCMPDSVLGNVDKSATSRRVSKFISHPYRSTYDVLGAPKVSQIYKAK